jgi:protease PrsW
MFYIHRNNQKFGPYPLDGLVQYVEDGKILLKDQASFEQNTGVYPVEHFLKLHHRTVNIKNEGGVIEQIKKLGKELIIPSTDFIKKGFKQDNRLLFLALIGLAPAILIRFTFTNYLTFYTIALYFSVIWALFFFYLFKTNQIEIKKAITVFFLTQFTALILVNAQVVPPLSFLYALTKSENIISQIVGFVFGVGVTEEIIKAIPIYYILKKSTVPLFPQTAVLYGLLSGIGFGVLEGVDYQTSTNTTLEYSQAFFMNIARLTSLPFLHAIWCGISSYFLSFSFLYPKFRKGLMVLSVMIPATLHGLYDVFGWSLIGLAICVLSVICLMYYLKKCNDYQSKLINV